MKPKLMSLIDSLFSMNFIVKMSSSNDFEILNYSFTLFNSVPRISKQYVLSLKRFKLLVQNPLLLGRCEKNHRLQRG